MPTQPDKVLDLEGDAPKWEAMMTPLSPTMFSLLEVGQLVLGFRLTSGNMAFGRAQAGALVLGVL